MPLWLVLVLFFASCVVFIAYQAAARENPPLSPQDLLCWLGWVGLEKVPKIAAEVLRQKPLEAPAAFSVRRCLPFAARRAAHTFDQEA